MSGTFLSFSTYMKASGEGHSYTLSWHKITDYLYMGFKTCLMPEIWWMPVQESFRTVAVCQFRIFMTEYGELIFWPNTNIFGKSNFQYSYSNNEYLETNIWISEYITKDNFWTNTNTNIFNKSNFQYLYSNIKYSETNIWISEYIWIFAVCQSLYWFE